MARVKDILAFLNQKAPFSFQEDFDNSGLLVGRLQAQVSRVLVALDITEEVISEAVEQHAELIVAHHPVIFHPVKQVTDESVTGRMLLTMIEHGIAAICAHTNLDKISGGVNDALARAAGLEQVGLLAPEGEDARGNPYGIGRVGVLTAPCALAEYVHRIKQALQTGGVRAADAGVPVYRVAVGGGACGGMLDQAAAQGCDTFLTADVKYSVFLEAKARGINLIDAGHFATENHVCQVLCQWLRQEFPQLEVLLSQRHRDAVEYL